MPNVTRQSSHNHVFDFEYGIHQAFNAVTGVFVGACRDNNGVLKRLPVHAVVDLEFPVRRR